MKTIAKVAIIAFLAWLFVLPKVTSFNDSYEEKFCKSYGQWNKYSWAVENQNSENWQNLEYDEYSKLKKIVREDSPSDDNYITKIATEWFSDSLIGDVAAGRTMAAILVVECEKNGVTIDDKYFIK
jgi:hypothetical protein